MMNDGNKHPGRGNTRRNIKYILNYVFRIYLYQFGHRTENSPWPSWSGVMHGDEIAYIFGDPLRSRPSLVYTEQERALARSMMELWANFAKTGWGWWVTCHNQSASSKTDEMCPDFSCVSMTNWPDVSVPYWLSPYFISVIPTKTRTDSGYQRPAARPGPPTPPQTESFSGSQQTIILSARGWGQSMNKLDFHLIWFSTHFRSQECHFWSTYLPQLLKKGIFCRRSFRN